NAARRGARSPPSRRRNRLLQRAPQLESEIGASSPCPLCSSGRRSFPRLPALDPLALSLLSPRQGAGASLPRQVCRRSQTGLRRRPTGLLRGSQAFGKSESVRFFPPSPLSAGLGGLLQAALRWSRTRSPLSRPLHPPRGDLQSPPGLPRGQTSDLPLERLCTRQPATVDDSGGRGGLAPLPAPRASPGLRPHSSFRLSGPPTAHRSLAPLLPVPGTTDRLATRPRTAARGGRRLLDPPAFHFHVVLPPVRRPHDHPGATKRGGNAPAFPTARFPEALMKYVIPIRSHRVRPTRPRSRVPGNMRAIHPSSPDPFTPSPRDGALTGSTLVLARRQPFHSSLYP